MLVSVSVFPLNNLLTYRVPEKYNDLAKIGVCVEVPLGRRKAKGYTQKDLADKLFVSDKAVSKWERGNRHSETAQCHGN